MPFFPRHLKRISPGLYVYRSRYELSVRTFPVLRLIVRPLAASFRPPEEPQPLSREEEDALLSHFGFDRNRRIVMELTVSGTVVYTQKPL